MRHRHLPLVLALAAALGACKSESKQPAPGPVALDAAAAKPSTTDAGAPAAAIDAAPAATGDTLQKPFFYAVSKDGKTVHFLGSIHMGVDPSRLPKVVLDRATTAKTFAMETDLSNQMALLKKLMRTDGSTLEQELGPEYWAKLDEAIGKSIPGGVKMINGMKAAVAAAQLEALGLPVTEAMDLKLHGDAKARGAKLVYLEEPETQADMMVKWLDVRVLKYQLDHLGETKDMHEQLLAAYIAGDDKAMEDLMAGTDIDHKAAGFSDAELAQMQDDMLYKRNAAWIAPIEQMAAEGDAFIVVGVAHLLGEKSVLDLLQAKGYTVERIKP